jgi:membrane protein implicated in regulation of membrane protease activity
MRENEMETYWRGYSDALTPMVFSAVLLVVVAVVGFALSFVASPAVACSVFAILLACAIVVPVKVISEHYHKTKRKSALVD